MQIGPNYLSLSTNFKVSDLSCLTYAMNKTKKNINTAMFQCFFHSLAALATRWIIKYNRLFTDQRLLIF